MLGSTFKLFLSIFTVIFFIYLGISAYFVYKYIRSDDSNRNSNYNKVKLIGLIGIVILIFSILTLIAVYILEPEKVITYPPIFLTEAEVREQNPQRTEIIEPILINTNN